MQVKTRTRGLGPSIAMWAVTVAALMILPIRTSSARSIDEAEGVLFRESFDDARLPERGWYDGQTFAISREGARAGTGCIAYPWKPGTTTPDRSSALRHQFETDRGRLSTLLHPAVEGLGSWTGRSYHPHLMHFPDDRE